MRHIWSFNALLLFVFILASSVGAQGSGPVTEVIVTAVDASQFPNVTVYARTLNAAGEPVSGLTTANLHLLENGQRVELTRGPVAGEGPLWVHFVIDAGLRMGQADRWNQTREAIRQFAQNWKQPDDYVAISAIVANNPTPVPLLEFTKNANDVTAVLDAYRPPTCANANDCLSAPMRPLGQILNNMDTQTGSDDQPRLVVLFTSELEKFDQGEPAALASNAEQLGIPIYAVLVASRDTGQVANLATNSGGQSLNLAGAASADDFFRAIAARWRPLYEMVYRSKDGLASTRPVDVVVDDGRVTGQAEYSINQIDLPRVTIESPAENARISPEATAQVVAKVVFTDNYTRNLQRATLTVNGVPADPLTNITGSSEITFPFPWSLVDESGEVTLSVIVKDEFNLDSRPASVKVTAVLPTVAAPTDEPDPGLPGGTNGTVTAPGTDGAGENPMVGPPSSSWSDILLPISIVLLAVAMIAVVLTRNRGPVLAVRQTINNQIERITKRIEKQSNPRAYLTVLEGDVSVGKKLEIYGTTTIGRAKQDSELLFQQHDDTSPISRRHCTIIDDEDHFMIRDEDSANGTFLNGVRLESMQPRELQDGDEIELARVERGGVKLQFESAMTSYGNYGRDPYTDATFDSGRSTRVVRRPNQSGGGDRF